MCIFMLYWDQTESKVQISRIAAEMLSYVLRTHTKSCVFLKDLFRTKFQAQHYLAVPPHGGFRGVILIPSFVKVCGLVHTLQDGL
jgi:hypothetical protein